MMKFYFITFILLLGTSSNLKSQNSTTDTDYEWLSCLGQKGLDAINDSLQVNEEFIEVLNDSALRKMLFPGEYTWSMFTQLVNKKQLKPAFWYLINLYPQNEKNKSLVLYAVIQYDKIFKMDEVMLNTFYTYSFMDVETSEIKNGIPEIVRPDIMEEKLRVVKEIISGIHLARNIQKTDTEEIK